ncbi:MAG: hypothetical protein KBD85_01605 [Elusimicrobia bacterium]|nr:hypothetical protein [Elusimicrobiota bacterium]MBP9698689.1 hypothetical protein [Elusimicrobiota bacterium]
MRAYRVKEDMEVPFGQVIANPKFGKGGGNQFYIEDWKNLDPVRDFKLRQ